MSIVKKIKIAALTSLLTMAGMKSEAQEQNSPVQAKTPRTEQDSMTHIRKVNEARSKEAYRWQMIHQADSLKKVNSKFGEELKDSKRWEKQKVMAGMVAPAYDRHWTGNSNNPSEYRNNYRFYRNLMETMLTFKKNVDCQKKTNTSALSQTDIKDVSLKLTDDYMALRFPEAQKNFMKQNFGGEPQHIGEAVFFEYKGFGVEINKSGKAVYENDLVNPRRAKTEKKRLENQNRMTMPPPAVCGRGRVSL